MYKILYIGTDYNSVTVRYKEQVFTIWPYGDRNRRKAFISFFNN